MFYTVVGLRLETGMAAAGVFEGGHPAVDIASHSGAHQRSAHRVEAAAPGQAEQRLPRALQAGELP